MVFREGRLVTSFSQIDKYMKCPHNWELKYLNKINIDNKSKHLEYGLAVHETLECVFRQKQYGSGFDFTEIKQIFFENVLHHEIPFDSPEEKRQWMAAGIEMIESLLSEDNDFFEMLMQSEILGIELPLEIPIDIASIEVLNKETGEYETHDKVWIIGFIDLVLRTDEGIVVIDHKSGGKKFDKAKLRADLQFPIYSIAIKHLFGEYPVKCYYNFTKIHEAQVVKVAEIVTADMEAVMNKRGAKEIYCLSPNDAERVIRQVFKNMGKKKHKAIPTPLCFWCDYGYHQYGICLESSKWCPSKK